MSSALKELVDSLEKTLEEYLDGEIERVEAERDFLGEVLNGRGGANIEKVSSALTTTYLSGSLEQYILIDKGDSDG